MPKGNGIKCGNSYISRWKECHDGDSSAHPGFVSGRSKQADELKDKILKNLSQYSPDQQKAWEGYIEESFKTHGSSKLRGQEDVYLLKLKGWEGLTREGPPKELFDQNGESVGGSRSLVPTVTNTTGAPAWRAVERGGIVYKFEEGRKGQEGQWRQSTVSMYNDIASGRVQRAIDLYEKQKAEAQRTGKPINYPVTNFGKQLTKEEEQEVDRLVAEVIKNKKLGSVAGNGTNRNMTVKVGNPEAYGRTLVSAVQNRMLRDDREYAEQRAREIITAYVRQGKVSSFTGDPVSIPSLREKDGYPSVVDHDTPLSTAWKGNPQSFRDPQAARAALAKYDIAGNFSITERGLNTAKSDKTDWEEITTIWKRRIEEQKRFEKEAEKVVDLSLGARSQGTVKPTAEPNIVKIPSQAPKTTQYTRATPKKKSIQDKLDDILGDIRNS